jgi:predicted SAM-dependent methyltransferase
MGVLEHIRELETGGKEAPSKLVVFELQNAFGHLVYRRPPPNIPGATFKLLNLGCGDCKFPGWVNADMYRFHNIIRHRQLLPDWMLDARKRWNCPSDYWDGFYSEHMLEHLTYADGFGALKECFRTLKPGAWIRLVLPDLRKSVAQYTGMLSGSGTDRSGPAAANIPDTMVINGEVKKIRYRAFAISNLAQNYGHISLWDFEVLAAVLEDIGFHNVKEIEFGKGTNPTLIRDSAARRSESFYVEAQKPA